MIEMVLLGFLMDGEKTGYEIKKYMENSTHYFFNIGFSSIYPKFKKLEKDGCVRASEKIKNGKLNKVYTLTEPGKNRFEQWLKVTPEISRIRDEALLKVFFYDYLDRDMILDQMAEYGNELKEQVHRLQGIKDRFSGHKLDPWKMKTLDFGIRYYTFLEENFSRMLDGNTDSE